MQNQVGLTKRALPVPLTSVLVSRSRNLVNTCFVINTLVMLFPNLHPWWEKPSVVPQWSRVRLKDSQGWSQWLQLQGPAFQTAELKQPDPGWGNLPCCGKQCSLLRVPSCRAPTGWHLGLAGLSSRTDSETLTPLWRVTAGVLSGGTCYGALEAHLASRNFCSSSYKCWEAETACLLLREISKLCLGPFLWFPGCPLPKWNKHQISRKPPLSRGHKKFLISPGTRGCWRCCTCCFTK